MRRLTHPVFTITNNGPISLLLAFHNTSMPHGRDHFKQHVDKKRFNIDLFQKIENCNNGHKMKMYFHFDPTKKTLFSFIDISETRDVIIASVLLFILSIIHQFFYCLVRFIPKLPKKKIPEYEEIGGSVQDEETGIFKKITIPKFVWYFVKPIAYLIQLVLGYFLMLIIMSYNAGYFISIVTGTVLGWSVFSMSRNIEPENCCQ